MRHVFEVEFHRQNFGRSAVSGAPFYFTLSKQIELLLDGFSESFTKKSLQGSQRDSQGVRQPMRLVPRNGGQSGPVFDFRQLIKHSSWSHRVNGVGFSDSAAMWSVRLDQRQQWLKPVRALVGESTQARAGSVRVAHAPSGNHLSPPDSAVCVASFVIFGKRQLNGV